jgi:hypothetical protein
VGSTGEVSVILYLRPLPGPSNATGLSTAISC